MATVKVKFRASSVKTREGTLYFQVIHNRVARQVTTDHKLFPSEWDRFHSRILLSECMDDQRREYLLSLNGQVSRELAFLKSIIFRMEGSGAPFTSDEIVKAYQQAFDGNGFFSFIRQQMDHLEKIGRYSALEKLRSAFNSFLLFYGKDDMPFTDVDTVLMEEYEGFLHEKGLCMNTISFYMRILRSVYNIAVARGLTIQQYPFKSVYTGIDQTVKRAISLKTVRRIRGLNLTSSPVMEWARDLFMFSFYTRGMSFVDMAYLKKTDLQNGVLVYRRQKTNQQLTIKWEKPMQDIVNKYASPESPYLLPIIRDTHTDARLQYKNAIHLVNNKLKLIGKEIRLGIPLTTYVARHGWASIAKHKNIPIGIISEALGHDSEKTTRIYLDSLDTSAVDKANSQILNSL